MEENILKGLQDYLEFIRYNTMDFGSRLLMPFFVSHFTPYKDRYKVCFNDNVNDCYWVEKDEYDKFLNNKLSNNVILRTSNAFKEGESFGYYMSLSENNIKCNLDNISILYGLRFKLNDIFYKIKDIGYQVDSLSFKFYLDERSSVQESSKIVEDKVKLYVVEDFYAEDFLYVNKFSNTSRQVKRGMGYSIEIDDDHVDDFVLVSDAKTAIQLSKKESLDNILRDLKNIFPIENTLSKKISEIIKKRLINEL